MKKDLYYYLRRAYKRFLGKMRSIYATDGAQFVPYRRFERARIDKKTIRERVNDYAKRCPRHEQHK